VPSRAFEHRDRRPTSPLSAGFALIGQDGAVIVLPWQWILSLLVLHIAGALVFLSIGGLIGREYCRRCLDVRRSR
jgi:hypothetical protein